MSNVITMPIAAVMAMSRLDTSPDQNTEPMRTERDSRQTRIFKRLSTMRDSLMQIDRHLLKAERREIQRVKC